MQNIIIATIKEWNISNYFKLKDIYKNKYNFHLITTKDELTIIDIDKLKPKYIFFPHWSWIIPKNIYDNFNCIVFHMTDLPYGRGGSPLQNLIVREIYDTKISALKVDDGLDTGDIYLKEDFNISSGNAQEIFTKLSIIIFNKMIPKLLLSDIIPQKQVGKIVNFKRRTPAQSNINTLDNKSLDKLYDFIRMLDGEGYPKAFYELENLKFEYMNIEKKHNKLIGRFEVTING
jgi:methionyl-tRNA formyltransferase